MVSLTAYYTKYVGFNKFERVKNLEKRHTIQSRYLLAFHAFCLNHIYS